MPILKQLYGLYGEEHAFALPDFMHCETIEYRSKKHNWRIEMHRHAHLFQIFLFENGFVQLQLQNQKVELREACLLILPENTLHGFALSPEIRGMVLTLSQDFIETIFHNSPQIPLAFNQVLVLLSTSDSGRFQHITKLIYQLYTELLHELPEKKLVLQSYLTLLLTEVFRMYSSISGQKGANGSRRTDYYNAFRQNIRQSRSPQKSIRSYAQDLHITEVHLNRVCKQVAGMTASQVVQQFFVLEAEKHLLHTEYSISEIAYALNYKDPAYFSRVFKGVTGKSPKEFRKNWRVRRFIFKRFVFQTKQMHYI